VSPLTFQTTLIHASTSALDFVRRHIEICHSNDESSLASLHFGGGVLSLALLIFAAQSIHPTDILGSSPGI
jgi:hypothetical protein